jgi:hypothetical protein
MATPPQRRSQEIRSARFGRRPPTLAATLLALALVFSIAWVFFVRSSATAPAPAIAGVRGTYSWTVLGRWAGASTTRVDQVGGFSAVASGNAGGREAPRVDPRGRLGNPPQLLYSWSQSAYDAGGRVEASVGGALSPDRPATRTVGAWPPVWRLATHSPLDYQGLSAIVRAAVEDGDHTVGLKPLEQDGRRVWRAALTLDGRPVELVVDQLTGIVTWCTDGRSTFTAAVDWASPPPPGQTYSVPAPAGTDVATVRTGTAYAASPAAAGRTAGYDPLVSDLAPDGFALKAVATFPNGWDRAPGWLGVKQPIGSSRRGPAEPEVAQLYTRGLGWFTLEQVGPQAMGFLKTSLSGDLDPVSRQKVSYQVTTLQYGALKGATAATWYQASGPSLFVAGRRRAVFITGALTRQELVSFAEGLKPAGPGAGAAASPAPSASPTP